MEKLLGFKIEVALWEAFCMADKLANRLWVYDIPCRFALEDGVLSILIEEDQLEAAQTALKVG